MLEIFIFGKSPFISAVLYNPAIVAFASLDRMRAVTYFMLAIHSNC